MASHSQQLWSAAEYFEEHPLKATWIPRWLTTSILWVGIILCVLALWQHREIILRAIGQASASDWWTLSGLAMLCWFATVLAWHQYLSAYVGSKPSLTPAVRQVGLLLVGKYVPGGVFGFLARLHDGPASTRHRLFWAGLVEQANGVGLTCLVGAVLYASACTQQFLLLGLLPLLPALALAVTWLLHNTRLPWQWLQDHGPTQHPPRLKYVAAAVATQLIQILAWAGLIIWVAGTFSHADTSVWIGLAGAFLLAIGAGMLALFVPSGVGVREAAFIALTAPWELGEQALIIAAMMRVVSTMIDVLAGLIGTLAPAKGS